MYWILQNNLFNEEAYQVLLSTLQKYEIPHSIHKVIPFVGELVTEPPLANNNAICMGTYSMRHYAKKKGLYPGVFDLEPFDFTHQLRHWGTEMLNHDAIVTKFGEANFDETEMFIRPIHDSKSFPGKVFSKEEFYDWKRKVCVLEHDYGTSLTKDTLIQLCRPKAILAEYRFWIVKQKIVTASLYKKGEKIMSSPEVGVDVYDYVNRILNTKDQQLVTNSLTNAGWVPHEAFVIDVAETPEGMKVIEINTLNSSGFYAADIPKLVMKLETAFNTQEDYGH